VTTDWLKIIGHGAQCYKCEGRLKPLGPENLTYEEGQRVLEAAKKQLNLGLPERDPLPEPWSPVERIGEQIVMKMPPRDLKAIEAVCTEQGVGRWGGDLRSQHISDKTITGTRDKEENWLGRPDRTAHPTRKIVLCITPSGRVNAPVTNWGQKHHALTFGKWWHWGHKHVLVEFTDVIETVEDLAVMLKKKWVKKKIVGAAVADTLARAKE